MTTPRDALVAILASADPGELMTWAQLEDLAAAVLAAGWVSPAATAAHGRQSEPAVTDARAALRAPHAGHTKLQAVSNVLDQPRAG
ncbi:MAG TPA: hypothetical protein VES60_05445 [Nakamurella sp.]|nr:hypothetical protein [Nakamurella sp.]